MLSKDQGIILHRFKFGENAVIAKIYTRQYGLLSFIFKGIFSAKSKLRTAHLTPLNIVELDFLNHPSRQIKKIKELNCKPILHSLHSVPEKTALSAFLLEILNRAITEELTNEGLYESIEKTIIEIENSDKPGIWLPHLFLLELLQHLGHGIEADSYEEGQYFHLLEGRFSYSTENEAFVLNKPCSAALATLIHTSSAEKNMRKELLGALIRFHHIHTIGNKPLQSLNIFSTIHSKNGA